MNPDPESKTSFLSDWGDGMMGKLPSVSRKKRKRIASKRRRQLDRDDRE